MIYCSSTCPAAVNGAGFCGEMKIKFILPPARIGLGYFVNDEVEFDNAQGAMLIEKGFAVEIKEAKKPVEKTEVVEAPVKKTVKKK